MTEWALLIGLLLGLGVSIYLILSWHRINEPPPQRKGPTQRYWENHE